MKLHYIEIFKTLISLIYIPTYIHTIHCKKDNFLVFFSIKQILDIATKSKALNHHAIYEALISLFNSYLDNFGLEFSLNILNPIFIEIIADLENKLEKLHTVNVDSVVIVGIYLTTLLVAVEDNYKQRVEFLQK